MRQLQPAAKPVAPGSQPASPGNQAARQRQQQDEGVPKVMAGQETALLKLGGLGIAAMVVAGISLFGLVIALATRPDGSFEGQVGLLTEEKAGLARNLGKLRVEHAQLEQSRAKLQRRLDSVQNDHEELLALFKRNAEAESREVPVKVAAPENRVAQPNLPVRPPPPAFPGRPLDNLTLPPAASRLAPEGSDQRRKDLLAWARTWTTLAFPAPVTAIRRLTLVSADGQVKAPVRVGGLVQAVSLRGDLLVVSLMNSKNFTATVAVDATDYLKVIGPRYQAHNDKLAKRSVNAPASSTDHGASCVCATCRKKKNGGSLFPGL